MCALSSMVFFLQLTAAHLLSKSQPATAQLKELTPSDACSEFASDQPSGSVWNVEDCIGVWTDFEESVPSWLHSRLPDTDVWGGTGKDLRRAGSPCIVEAVFDPDGAGSTTIRNFATWIFSKELDCDWMTPRWSGQKVNQGNSTATMYCHLTATLEEAKLARSNPDKLGAALRATNRCSVVDWLSYFQFDVPSVTCPESTRLKIIQVSR